MRALLFALLLAVALPVQSAPGPFADAPFTVRSEASDPDVHIGTYRTAEAVLYVARSGPRLVLTLAGQAAFDAFAPAPVDARRNGRAEALLRDAFAGDTDRLAEALPVQRREAGTRDFARLLGTFTDRLGTFTSVQALGTMATPDGAATYVRVRFADGEELLKLKWRDGRLALITRSPLPQVTAHPVRGDEDRFAVLGADGEPATILVFGADGMTARSAGHTLVAARSL